MKNKEGNTVMQYILFQDDTEYGRFFSYESALNVMTLNKEANPNLNYRIVELDVFGNEAEMPVYSYIVYRDDTRGIISFYDIGRAIEFAKKSIREYPKTAVHKCIDGESNVKVWPEKLGTDKGCSNCQLCKYWDSDRVTCKKDNYVGMRYSYMANVLCDDFAEVAREDTLYPKSRRSRPSNKIVVHNTGDITVDTTPEKMPF